MKYQKLLAVLLFSALVFLWTKLKDYQIMEEEKGFCRAHYGMAVSIIQEPRILEKWLYFSRLFFFNSISKEEGNYLLNLKILEKQQENFLVEFKKEPSASSFQLEILFKELPNTWIKVLLEKGENDNHALSMEVAVKTGTFLANLFFWVNPHYQ